MSAENAWNEKLCDCTKDCGLCCYGYWCTPCLFGSNSEKIDNKNCCLMCCLYVVLANCYLCWIPHLLDRKTLRKKYNLREEPCSDCPITAFCAPCALCQEAREIKFRETQLSEKQVKIDLPVVTQPGAESNQHQIRF